ncbi:MAG: alanine racemase [Nitrospirae bacterium]|nr:alanine racemase [Nitrospirota bacterium]
MHRGAIAEINLSAIANNLHIVKDIVRYRPVIAVVKADAYGHGAIEVSKSLLKEGISHLAVAFIDEALELRNARIKAPIIVLFDRTDIKEFFRYNLIPVIHNMDMAVSFNKEANKHDKQIKVHVKIDTGMGRLGLYGKNVIQDLIRIGRMPGIELEGILSHFSEADLSDRSYADIQLNRFKKICKEVSKSLKKNLLLHIANSAAVIAYKDAHLDAVRPGIMLYGYSPISTINGEYFIRELIPAMTVKSKILSIRKLSKGTPISYGRTFVTKRTSRIGVIPVGYADGYNRLFSNNADMLVRGKRVPVVGRVCMDLTMIDLTDVKNATVDDEVIILGKQKDESIDAIELAQRVNTIPYEILTSIGSRSKRIYV